MSYRIPFDFFLDVSKAADTSADIVKKIEIRESHSAGLPLGTKSETPRRPKEVGYDPRSPIEGDDRSWVTLRLADAFGDTTVARMGISVDASALPGFVATE